MCHLSLEKSLKALYQKKKGEIPPRTHNLAFLMEQTGATPSEADRVFMIRLNEANIATRYPEELEMIQKNYPGEVAGDIFTRTREILSWIKQQL